MRTDTTVAGYIFKENIFGKPELLLIKHKKLGLWLPVGGHVELDKGETPPDAMIREAKEEVELDIILLNESSRNYESTSEINKCAIPFYSNIHNVGDHNHYCQFYICGTKQEKPIMNEKEILDSWWFPEKDLLGFVNKNNLAYLAFKKYKEWKNE